MKWSSHSRRTRQLLLGLSLPALLTGCQSSGSFLRSDESCTAERLGSGRSNLSGVSGDLNVHYSPMGRNVQRCRGNGDDCNRLNDFDRAAVPAPPGTYANQWNDAMICSARQYHLIVSRHEWFSGGIELGPEGRDHVASLAIRLVGNSDYVFVETEPVQLVYEETLNDATSRTYALNDARRAAVVRHLIDSGLAGAEQRVFMMPLEGVGVHGFEAPRIYNRLLFSGQGGGQGGNQNRGGNMGGSQGGNGGGGGFGGGGGLF